MAVKPVLVLVPGAYHAATYTHAVADLLRAQGFTVETPDLAVIGNDPATINKDAT